MRFDATSPCGVALLSVPGHSALRSPIGVGGGSDIVPDMDYALNANTISGSSDMALLGSSAPYRGLVASW